ncbi:hypothetical protein [Leucobacter sp. 1207-22]|uniref:hypothetical protein n=1 Tax=Leucobacter sp. 1207-22 TaxID=2604456 RepID=UPI004064C3DE
MSTDEKREHAAHEGHSEDHDSDPAHTPGAGWGEEGGASHLGPATNVPALDPDAFTDDEDADA